MSDTIWTRKNTEAERELPLGARVTFEMDAEYGARTYQGIVVGYTDGKNQVCEVNRGHYARNVQAAEQLER